MIARSASRYTVWIKSMYTFVIIYGVLVVWRILVEYSLCLEYI